MTQPRSARHKTGIAAGGVKRLGITGNDSCDRREKSISGSQIGRTDSRKLLAGKAWGRQTGTKKVSGRNAGIGPALHTNVLQLESEKETMPATTVRGVV